MDSKQLFLSALDSASLAISLVSEEDYPKPTPDTEWDVKTLSNHMLYELSWTNEIVRGRTILEVGNKYDGDLLIATSLEAKWQDAEKSAREAVAEADLHDVAHLSWQDTTNDFYLKQAAADQLIHSWDLSVALGRPVSFKPDVAQEIYNNTAERRQEMSSSGLFGEEISVPDYSDIQTKLLALYGRDINWRP